MDIFMHRPEPVKPPPPTFDIRGLTWDEMEFLAHLTGSFSCTGRHVHSTLFSKIYTALGFPDYSTETRFVANSDTPVEWLKCISEPKDD
jgi:hypothetical protein